MAKLIVSALFAILMTGAVAEVSAQTRSEAAKTYAIAPFPF